MRIEFKRLLKRTFCLYILSFLEFHQIDSFAWLLQSEILN